MEEPTMMGAPRKRARLEERAASEPLVSLEAIFRLGKETQRCVVEGEATFNAGHIVCCGITQCTDTVVRVQAFCLQTSALKGPPHTVKIDVSKEPCSIRSKCRQPRLAIMY
ncbi:hypothetical protein HPB50_018409 [Hyalomma asiaticum]|uniref:Uncharacterized protein n=1 Tax=Hyalomma asiaticum TaxID=266040 RepID=A0ACB7T8F2_HYAAI|nr:hypothetical protein HPB50_018409 [Hyalomma asiaticum]